MNRFSAQVKEVVNRNTLVSLALAEGFNAFLPVFDGGIDFILHRESDGVIRKVQLKGRWTIDRKYIGRDLWIAFPIEHEWYLAPHDAMIEMEAATSFIRRSRGRLLGFTSSRDRRKLFGRHASHFGSVPSRKSRQRPSRTRTTSAVRPSPHGRRPP